MKTLKELVRPNIWRMRISNMKSRIGCLYLLPEGTDGRVFITTTSYTNTSLC